ncbi:MAG: carbohydrate kinase family protein [Chloroflexota bacterium]|nr:carbohydrate kinase family protein [Chloroflexota bacterium]
MNKPRIVVMGNVVADVVARPVDELPRVGSLHPESVAFHPGGCAGNAATILARLGVDTHLVGCVGQDAFGRALLEAWQQRGINTSLVRQIPDVPTAVTIVLVDSQGERRFISTPGANHHLTPSMLPSEALEGAFALHIGGFFAAPGLEDGTLATRLAEAQRRGVLTSLDTVGGSARERRETLYPLLPHLDLLLLNEDEGEKVTGETNPDAMLDFLLSRGARTVILKQGDEGCHVVGERGPLTLRAFPATCVDSTGAGDAFAAALLATLARGNRFSDALRWASAAGAANVEALGATGAWQGWQDLERIMDRDA